MNFTTTAPDRKTLVKAIAEHFELDPNYNGPPTFNYSVGDITIDREGTVAIEDEKTAARLQAFQPRLGGKVLHDILARRQG